MKASMKIAAGMMPFAMLCQIAACSVSAEEQVAPNLAFARIKFADNIWEFEYTGEEIIPEFTVYVGAAEVPAQAYTYTVISTDGDGTSAGTNPGVVTFQISAVENPIFYGETTKTFTILPAEDIGEPLPGDVNADGRLDASDAALLQNWLLTVPDAALADPAAADLNGDGILNAADLGMMKQKLFAEKQVSYKILSQEWIDCGETKSLLCETAAGMDDVRGIQRAANDTSPLPPEIDDDFFADHILVMYYTSDFPGYRKLTVDSVTREQDAVHVQITSRFPMETIPDTRICRILLALDAADVPDAKKLIANTWFMPYWADENADNVPEIIDDSGELTETDIRQVYESLLQYVLLHETKADFRDFTFVYAPKHRLKNYIYGKPFYIYYKGILLYGGELNNDSCIFASTGSDTNFGVDPAEYSAVDLNAEIISAEDVLAMYPDRIQEPELVIYTNRFEDIKPTLAYRAFDRNEYGEYIVDAVTGEEITYIPYLTCVLPLEYA